MGNTEKQLLTLLQSIKGSGSFLSSGTQKFVFPGLTVKKVGELGFPLNAIQVKALIKVATKAPFGKGSQTVTDSKVRSAWEIDSKQISFHQSEDWDKLLAAVLKKVCAELALKNQNIQASLYKLLIYERGDFFLSHKDSEKEKGMFGTLIIGLPAPHTGGELLVRFDGGEEVVDFSKTVSPSKIPYAAFFADCEHELKPVHSGCRVVLVYNLIRTEKTKALPPATSSHHVEAILPVFQQWQKENIVNPKVILLGHQYTPSNFSLKSLKQDDKPRAEALLEAARKAGFFAKPALITCYQMGDLEGADHYYNRYDRYGRGRYECPSKGKMGSEIYEEYTRIEHWLEDGDPSLGNIDVEDNDIITSITLKSGKPIEQEEEGYTGNAGMTMEYWYHYGAIVLWSKHNHFELLLKRDVATQMDWLQFYLNHWSDKALNGKDAARQLVLHLSKNTFPPDYDSSVDFSPIAKTLLKTGDEDLLKKVQTKLLVPLFCNIKANDWVTLIQMYEPEIFHSIFAKAANTYRLKELSHLHKILTKLYALHSKHCTTFVDQQLNNLSDCFAKLTLHEDNDRYYISNWKEKTIALLTNLYTISTLKNKDNNWIKKMVKHITNEAPSSFINNVVVASLLNPQNKPSSLRKELQLFCIEDLKARTATEPSPPKTWTRNVPGSKDYANCLKIISSFLRSPTEMVFDYRAAMREREQMEYAIKHAEVDVKTQTIRQGSPHILRLTKTQASFEKAHKQWKIDLKLLDSLIKMK